MWRTIVVAISLGCVSCVAKQPPSAATVAAYEVPLPTEADRTSCLELLRAAAAVEGLHIDVADQEQLRRTADAIPAAKRTIHAGIWRGEKDTSSEGVIMDGADHLGLVWIMFSRGEDADAAKRYRERVMRQVRERWPETRTLPIMPTGAIPLHGDLRLTPRGYLVKPSASSRYGLSPTSPLVARP